MPTQWIDLKVTLDRIRLKAYQRDRVHYCEYIAVVCIDEEDGLEILCRAKGDNEFRFGCRATGRVPCTASIEPGDLDEVFVKFYQTLFIPYATPSVEKDGFLTFPSRVYVWLFEVGFPKDVLISREKQTSGQFNESGRLIIPCTDVPLTMMMKFPYKHMPDLSRNSFILSLVGISLLLDNRKSYPQSSFCLSESLDEDSTVQQTYEHEHSPFNTPLYNGKSLFYFFSGTCVLPSWINSTKLTVPILIGEVSGRCSIIPSSFTSQLPLFPGNRRSLFGKDRLNDESTKSRCFPMIRGIRFHFKRIIGLPLRSFVQGQVPATIPTADIFQALQGKHLFRAMWRNDSEQATHNLDDEGYLGHLLKEHDGTGPPMHGQWIVCSNQVVFTSLKDMTNTQLVCVDFNISEQVFMTLPLGGQYELQCYFWVKPTVRVSGITLKEMVVLTLQQPLSVLSHIDDASLYIPLCECGSPEGCQVSLHLSLHGIPAPETSVTHSVHRRLGLPTQEHQPSSYRLGIQGIQATYNNVYSILTRYLKPDENQKLPGRMIQIQSEDVEDAGGGIRSWCQFLLCEKNEDRKLSELSVVDAKHVWIISGNPESHVVAGKSYLFDLDVDPFHSQSKTIDKAFFCKSLTVDIIDEGALTLRVDQGTHAWGASRANDRLEWRVEPSNYLSTLSCRFLRVGSYLLHIRVGGRDIVSSPFSIRCIAGRPDSSKTRLEVFPCLASVLGSCRSSVFSSMFSSYRTSLNPPLYINKLGFQLRDALENPVKMAYSVFSAQSLTQGLDVLHVINYENGTYDVLYRITLTPSCLSNCLDLPPTFRVVAYVNGRTVGGFPLTLNPENMNEINEYYRQLEEVTEQPLWELEALLKKNDVFQAKHYLKSYREQWCKNVRTSAQTIEAVIQQLQTLQDATKTLLSTDTCVSPAILSTGECSLNIKKAQQALDQLKKRWILSHTLR